MYVENKQWVLVLSLHSRQTLSGSGMKVFVNFIWSCEETKIYTDPVFSSVLYKRILRKEFM